MTAPAAAAPSTAAVLQDDDRAWDAFVAATPTASYLQLTAWARVKAVNGWRAERVVVDAAGGPLAAQLLVRRLGRLGALGYAPRGPVAAAFAAEGVTRLTAALEDVAREAHLVALTIEPQVPAGDPLEGWLRAAGWRAGPRVQDPATRLIDLRAGEGAVWADLRSKWRQYVEKARRAGVVVEEAGAEGLADFYRIYQETAVRTGFVIRAVAAYRDVYEAFAAQGACRLLFARLPGGERSATLLLVACGPRLTELYGGMTGAGAEARANYLLKWEAIRAAAASGFTTYDLWGLATPGIAHFKAGFGGREVRYAGAFDLVLQPRRLATIRALAATRERLARLRTGRSAGAGDDGRG
jgi:lipid II:glycine glycyltransferase (peptidoglycan interpeptide bridge formation enzyme)